MVAKQGFHEDLNRHQDVQAGSERGFGIVFAVVFALIGLWPLTGDGGVRIWALAIAGAFLFIGFVFPRLLKPLNILWFKFGMLLHKVVTPLIMGLIFFVTVTPIALIMRATGKRLLNLQFDEQARSYWVERQPPGPAPETMRNQF